MKKCKINSFIIMHLSKSVMKFNIIILLILISLESRAVESKNPNCFFDTDDYNTKSMIEEKIGNYIYLRIESHLNRYGISLLKNTLTVSLHNFKEESSLIDGYEYEPWISVETNSNQKLVVRFGTSYFVGHIKAKRWLPDGSAVDAKCYMVHNRFDEADPFIVKNWKTDKEILKIYSKEIPPLPIYEFK